MRAVLVASLSTGHKIGLAVVAGVFIVFALVSSFVAPRRNPDFPGRGAGVYYIATFLLFLLMLGAVEVFGAEGGEPASAAEAAKPAQGGHVLSVTESEYRIQLPSQTARTLKAGAYVLHVVNKGKQTHNFFVNGPGVSNRGTPNLQPGGSADLRVTLVKGSYDVYCAIPGHKQLGMDAKLAVG